MTTTAQAPAITPAADPVTDDIWAAGVRAAATMRPMSEETAGVLVSRIANAIQRDNPGNGGAR